MKKGILSLALALTITLALTIPTFAAGKTETIKYDHGLEWLKPATFEVTNVTSQEKKDFSVYDSDEGKISRKNATVIHCNAPTTITFRQGARDNYLPDGIWVWWDANKIPKSTISWNYKTEYAVGSSVTFTKTGTYAISLYDLKGSEEKVIFFVVGGSSSAPANTTPSTQTTTQKPAAPSNTTQEQPTAAPTKPADKSTVKVAGENRTPGQLQNINSGEYAGSYMYTVNYGDTLYDISNRFYGSGDYWKELQKVNQKNLSETKDGIIFVGFNLIIPAELDGIRANIG